jgi:hypothetical protein
VKELMGMSKIGDYLARIGLAPERQAQPPSRPAGRTV